MEALTMVQRPDMLRQELPATESIGAEALLARAGLWQWAARAFWYPEADFLAALSEPERRPALDAAAAALPSPSPLGALAAVWTAVDALGETPLSLAEEHTALFARRVLVPPHGTVYGAGLGSVRTQDLARVASFYEAFGFRVSQVRAELADHVSVELEFTAALCGKEAYARAQGWPARAARVARARRLFLEEHLAPWFPKFSARLAQHSRVGFYPAVAAFVLTLLDSENTAELANGTATVAQPGAISLGPEEAHPAPVT
ncbi:MAG: molecular chaperone TorD family protein [Chloroflexi bacterium]|nr:molecular chaperone TorD family protein [Chloroflexota bacterium]